MLHNTFLLRCGHSYSVIEDEAVLALDLSDLLQAEGYVVVGIASNGPQALALYQAHPVDLVLCDIRIQGPWDDIETVMRLGTGRAVPVIYLSAFSDMIMRERAVQTLPAYLPKPVQFDSRREARTGPNKERQGDYRLALEYQREATAYADTLTNQE